MAVEEDDINAVIGEFVKAYKGEINASIVQFSRKGFTVRFSGALCKNCGPEDYIQGFAYMLKLKGIEVNLGNYREDNGTYVAEYFF